MTIAISTVRYPKNVLAMIAWPAMLLVSMLPDILFLELSGSLPSWLFWAKLALIGALLLVSLFRDNLRPLRLFFGVLLALYRLVLRKHY